MRNIEIVSKQHRPDSFFVLNGVEGRKTFDGLRLLRNGLELLSVRITRYMKVIAIVISGLSIVVLAILYFTSDRVRNARNTETWTKTDLSNTHYDFTSDAGNFDFHNSKLKL